MKDRLLKVIFTALIIGVSAVANAGLITVVDTSGEGEGSVFNINVTDYVATSDVNINIEFIGDLNSRSEYLDIEFAGSISGRLFDKDNSNNNGWITNPSDQGGDTGDVSHDSSIVTRSISSDDWNTMYSGTNLLTIASPNVDDEVYYHVVITSQGNAATDIPEPTTLVIFALGLFGLASRWFMKKS